MPKNVPLVMRGCYIRGSVVATAKTLLPSAASASEITDAKLEGNNMGQNAGSANIGHYKPPFRFAMGGVPLGNEFEFVTDDDAYATIEAAWNAGVRYYDMAPWYRLGLAERRYGNFLHNKHRNDYVLSTKVGKFIAGLYNWIVTCKKAEVTAMSYSFRSLRK